MSALLARGQTEIQVRPGGYPGIGADRRRGIGLLHKGRLSHLARGKGLLLTAES